MRKSLLLTGAVLAAAAFAAGALAADSGVWIGSYRSHRSIERFDMSVGVTASQQPRRPTRFDEDREVFTVPGHYGTLVGLTGDSHVAVLWFRDGEGTLRNTVVQEPAAHGYEFRLGETTKFEADAREQ